MLLNTFRFLAVVLAALSLTMESAHVLELPQKMQYSAELYTAVNSTLYRYFAIVGGVYQVGSIVSAAILAFLVRSHRRLFRWTLAGALLLLIAFIVWGSVVAPVNSMVAEAALVRPETLPRLWMDLRGRWEYGHAAGFVIQLAGLCALVVALIIDRSPPAEHSRPAA